MTSTAAEGDPAREDRVRAWVVLAILAAGVVLSPLVGPIIRLIIGADVSAAARWLVVIVAFLTAVSIVLIRPTTRSALMELAGRPTPTSRRATTLAWVSLFGVIAIGLGFTVIAQSVPGPWHDVIIGLSEATTFLIVVPLSVLFRLLPLPHIPPP